MYGTSSPRLPLDNNFVEQLLVTVIWRPNQTLTFEKTPLRLVDRRIQRGDERHSRSDLRDF
jgi:hypothetical protein